MREIFRILQKKKKRKAHSEWEREGKVKTQKIFVCECNEILLIRSKWTRMNKQQKKRDKNKTTNWFSHGIYNLPSPFDIKHTHARIHAQTYVFVYVYNSIKIMQNFILSRVWARVCFLYFFFVFDSIVSIRCVFYLLTLTLSTSTHTYAHMERAPYVVLSV